MATASAACRGYGERVAHPSVVVLADLTSWEAWLHLAAALRRHGIRVIRYTGMSGGRAQQMRVAVERAVFNQTFPLLRRDADGVDVGPLLTALDGVADIQMVDAIGAVLTGTPQWAARPDLHRVHADVAETAIYDKWAYSTLAQAAGVAVPTMIEVPDALPSGDWVLKGKVGSGGDRVAMVNSTEELRKVLRAWRIGPQEAFVQQRVGGELWNVGGVAHRGEVLVSSAYRAFSSANDPEGPPVDIQIGDRPAQLEATAALVASLGYSGPFAIDFLDDDRPYLLDFNPRFFGTWAAMQSAGVDLLGAYLSTLGRAWQPRPEQVDESVIPSSAIGATGVAGSWRRARELTSRIGPIVGPVAGGIITMEGLASARPRGGSRPMVTVAYSEPWLAALQWGSALRRAGLDVRRCTVHPDSRGQSLRQRGEGLCFSETRRVLRDDGRHVLVEDPQALVQSALDVQITERVLIAMLATDAWQERSDVHHVPDDVDQRLLCDKELLLEWAAGRGVPVPGQWRGDEQPDRFPVIVKPSVGYGGVGVVVCSTGEEVQQARAALNGLPDVVQEFLPGRQVNVGGVALRGRVLVTCAYVPLAARDNPQGPPVALRTIDDEQALAVAAAAVGGLQYTGPFCADLVADADGSLRLVDLNARVFGSWTGLQRAGVDILGGYLHTLDLAALPASNPQIGREVSVDVDPSAPLRPGLRAMMAGMRPLTGVQGLTGQTVQILSKQSRA